MHRIFLGRRFCHISEFRREAPCFRRKGGPFAPPAPPRVLRGEGSAWSTSGCGPRATQKKSFKSKRQNKRKSQSTKPRPRLERRSERGRQAAVQRCLRRPQRRHGAVDLHQPPLGGAPGAVGLRQLRQHRRLQAGREEGAREQFKGKKSESLLKQRVFCKKKTSALFPRGSNPRANRGRATLRTHKRVSPLRHPPHRASCRCGRRAPEGWRAPTRARWPSRPAARTGGGRARARRPAAGAGCPAPPLAPQSFPAGCCCCCCCC